MDDAAPVITDSLAGAPLAYSNDSGEFTYAPAEFEVRLTGAALRRQFCLARRLTLLAPPGWSITCPSRLVLDPTRTLVWRVRPTGEPSSCLMNVTVTIDRGDGRRSEIVHGVPVEVRAGSQFSLDRHAYPFANAATEVGEVAPERATFAATYRHGGPLADAFFRGLYSDVVYLTADPSRPRPGGLCTGIARSSLEFSLRQPAARLADQDAVTLRATAALWHGRQLADRALVASTAAWVWQGSRDAYGLFRRRLLATGRTDIAMDVNVPRPWRRDLLTALIGSGHTVVPYALRQASDDRADVWVYDPNFPSGADARQSVIHFDLANDTFTYRAYRGDIPGRPAKVIAVDQAHYRAATTGYLGGLISAALYPRRCWPAARRPWLGGVLAALVAVATGLVLRRGPNRCPSR